MENNASNPVPKRFLTVCLVGLILFAGGMALVMGSHLLKSSGSDYCHSYFSSTGESVLVRTAGMIMAGLGIVTAIAGLLSAGFLSVNIEKQTRTALLGSGTGLLVLLLIITLIYSFV